MDIVENCIICRKKFKDINNHNHINFFLSEEDLFQWKPIKIKVCDKCLSIICKNQIKKCEEQSIRIGKAFKTVSKRIRELENEEKDIILTHKDTERLLREKEIVK